MAAGRQYEIAPASLGASQRFLGRYHGGQRAHPRNRKCGSLAKLASTEALAFARQGRGHSLRRLWPPDECKPRRERYSRRHINKTSSKYHMTLSLRLDSIEAALPVRNSRC